MTNKFDEYLWVEKYRPRKVSDCILSESLRETFQQMVDAEEMQNLLLSGGAGCGKTTIAKAMCEELGCDYMVINCSEDGNIDTLRTKIRNFASSVSMSGGKKVVILDEFDYSNAQSMQPALRGFIEEFSKNCRFILTCNYKNRIIEPIHSRCTCVEFTIPAQEKPNIAKGFMDRVKFILDSEGVSYDEKVLVQLIMKHFPDFRRTINELQRYSVAGSIDVGVLTNIGEIHISDLMKSMKDKDFSAVRKWVVDNLDNSQVELFRSIYTGCYEYMQPSSVPQAILIIAEYQYKSAFVADQEVNLAACCIQLMMECSFK
tara:strand:- start:5524 stop:6471 length:948 start_codon:yes stop_codon:yes gene_type:complete